MVYAVSEAELEWTDAAFEEIKNYELGGLPKRLRSG
jgi:hypothetical protein